MPTTSHFALLSVAALCLNLCSGVQIPVHRADSHSDPSRTAFR
jgi:hypothetical protein